MKLEYREIDLEWPSGLHLYDLKNYILSKLIRYGEPLRWAITSLTNHSEKKNQMISIEVVFIINEDQSKVLNSILT